MQVCIDQNVLSKFPNLTAIGNDDVVMTIKMAGDKTSDFPDFPACLQWF